MLTKKIHTTTINKNRRLTGCHLMGPGQTGGGAALSLWAVQRRRASCGVCAQQKLMRWCCAASLRTAWRDLKKQENKIRYAGITVGVGHDSQNSTMTQFFSSWPINSTSDLPISQSRGHRQRIYHNTSRSQCTQLSTQSYLTHPDHKISTHPYPNTSRSQCTHISTHPDHKTSTHPYPNTSRLQCTHISIHPYPTHPDCNASTHPYPTHPDCNAPIPKPEPGIAHGEKKKKKKKKRKEKRGNFYGGPGACPPPPPILKVETKICAIWGILEEI